MKQVITPSTPSKTDGGATNETKVKPVALSEISYQAVLEMSVEDQDRLMKSFHGATERLADTRDEVKTASKYAAVLLAGVEARVKRDIDAKIYASTFTASDLYKQVTGEKPPGHVWTMKNCYVNFVLTGLIADPDFIGNRNNCLELAQRIADAVFERDPAAGLQHDAVTRAANELKTRNEDEAKVLRSILNSVKPLPRMTDKEALEAFTEIIAAGHLGIVLVGMTPETALACFERICLDGHLPVALAQMPDNVVTLDEAHQKDAYMACSQAIERVDVALGDKVETWLNPTRKPQATRKPKDKPVLAPTLEAAPETPAPEELIAA
jgi:hypothetical protein